MTFEAKFGGRCAACHGGITPGDQVVYVDDELVHADCEGDALADVMNLRRPAATCGTCFMEKPCPCDDGQGPTS